MRFATWNMQGGINIPYINQVVQQSKCDVLCLQECGSLAQNLRGRAPIIHAGGAIIGFTGNFVVGQGFMECVCWDNNDWPQGSLAILSNVNMIGCGILNAVPIPGFAPAFPRNLPWIKITDPQTGGAYTVYSIHSPPVFGGTTLANVCAWNNAQIMQIAGAPGTWMCLGDFNADPTVAGFVAPPAGNVVRGNQATQQGEGLLDYAVTSAALPPLAYAAQNQLAGASDHYPQVFQR